MYMLTPILQKSVWRFAAIQMLEHCMNESAWRNSRMSTEPSASPWTLKAGILERFSPTPNQSNGFLQTLKIAGHNCVPVFISV